VPLPVRRVPLSSSPVDQLAPAGFASMLRSFGAYLLRLFDSDFR
jgi:hypothetical protein